MRNLAGNFNTLVQDLSCGTRVDTNDRTADRCLSGTGLAYEGEGLSLVDVKRSIFYRDNSNWRRTGNRRIIS